MTSTPPERPDDPHRDPNLGAGDHEPTVDVNQPESTVPMDSPTPPQQYPPPPPPQPAQPAYGAPYGIDPKTGLPYSDKSKVVAGLLQLLIPLGIGRFYTGHTGLAVAQLLVTLLTCGVGGLWPFIDGIVILVGDSRDAHGRPLRS